MLLIVLIVITLLTIAVIEFTYSTEVDARRARNALDSLQASLLARGALNMEEAYLLLDEDARFDAYTEDWYVELQEQCLSVARPNPNTELRCGLRDESGKLNINMSRPRHSVRRPSQRR